VTFLTVQSLPFFLDLALSSNRWTNFHALFCGSKASNDVIPRKGNLLGVRIMGDVIWRKYASKTVNNGRE